MPNANNNGVSIHYHVDGQGPPLVMQHGMTQTLRSWYDSGYVDGLKQDYQLILIDARGHGRSDKPHDPAAYELVNRVNDVLAVMDECGVDKAHYMGFSLGGRIGFGIAMHAVERFHSLIIGGMSGLPSLNAFDPQQQADALRRGMEAYVADAEAQEGPLPDDRKAVLLANDAEALAASVLAPSRHRRNRTYPAQAGPALFALLRGRRRVLRRFQRVGFSDSQCGIRDHPGIGPRPDLPGG